MCTPDMVWRPKQEISHEKRCLLDSTTDGSGPAFAPLGPDHPRIFNERPRYTTQTQRPTVYTPNPTPRPVRPSYNVPNLVRESTYAAPAPRGYGRPISEPLGPKEWLKAKNL